MPQATSSPRPASIVGRWEVLRTCEGDGRGPRPGGSSRARSVSCRRLLPDKSPKQLARKADICQRAKPQQHSHFFTDDGQFGSLDQHEQRVDDAPYSVIDDRALRLSPEFGEETYRYRIVGGNELTLEPIIPTRSKHEALANPLKFSLAGHSAAVAYTGHTWEAGRMRRVVLETSLLLRNTRSSAGGRCGDCRSGR